MIQSEHETDPPELPTPAEMLAEIERSLDDRGLTLHYPTLAECEEAVLARRAALEERAASDAEAALEQIRAKVATAPKRRRSSPRSPKSGAGK